MAPRFLTITRLLAPALALAVCLPASGMAQLSTFTYQGRLRDGGVPVNGSYDLRFILYTLAAGGSQVGATIYVDDVPIGDGLFATDLDFGASSFPGDVRFLEVAVRPGAVSNADRDPLTYTTLNPRQRLNSTPYSIRARDADTIDGFDSSVFLTGVPNPLSITNDLTSPIVTVINTSNTTGTALSATATGTGGGGVGFQGVSGEALPPLGIGVLGSANPIAYVRPSGVCGTSATGIGVAGTTDTGFAMFASAYGTTGFPIAIRAHSQAPAGKAVVATNSDITRNSSAELASVVSGALEPLLNGLTTAVMASSPQIGVYGRSDGDATGVYGESGTWTGVLGKTVSGQGVMGVATTSSGVALSAIGSGISIASQGTALQILNGAIRVPNAGLGTSTPVFIHRATAGNISSNFTYIDHPLTNGDPNAILIITPNWNPGGVGGTYNANPIGVFYDGGAAQKWAIFNQNIAAMTVNQSFNVLVVKAGPALEPQIAASASRSSASQPPLVPIVSAPEGVRVDFVKSDRK